MYYVVNFRTSSGPYERLEKPVRKAHSSGMSDSLGERRPVPHAARDRTDTAQQGVGLTSELASQAPIAADTASTATASADRFADTASDAVGVAQAHADVAKAVITAAQEAASPSKPSWIYGMVIGFLGVAYWYWL